MFRGSPEVYTSTPIHRILYAALSICQEDPLRWVSVKARLWTLDWTVHWTTEWTSYACFEQPSVLLEAFLEWSSH